MVANILPIDTLPPTLGVGSKGQNSTFSEHDHVVYQIIKLKGMLNAGTCKHIFCPYTLSRSLGWGQRSKDIFLKIVILHFKLMGMEQIATC